MTDPRNLSPSQIACKVTLDDGRSLLSRLAPDALRSVSVLTHGSLLVKLYAPVDEDRQVPHDRDEIYVVMEGTGTFRSGETANPFGPGDVLFVPAGRPHRFESFTPDLTVWVIFYGPEGGE
ncbi:MAG: cupin domain-containing protein [Betaproteobacteria bacterium]|nr:cupin domain-containing protein [Betaproteobacteria bacterium]